MIAAWGVAFKDGTDDLRCSTAMRLVEALLSRGAAVRVHDAHALEAVRRSLGDRVRCCVRPLDALQGAHALVIGTEWPGYAEIEPRILSEHLAPGAIVFDSRNLFSPERFGETALSYLSIGRSDQLARGAIGEGVCLA